MSSAGEGNVGRRALWLKRGGAARKNGAGARNAGAAGSSRRGGRGRAEGSVGAAGTAVNAQPAPEAARAGTAPRARRAAANGRSQAGPLAGDRTPRGAGRRAVAARRQHPRFISTPYCNAIARVALLPLPGAAVSLCVAAVASAASTRLPPARPCHWLLAGARVLLEPQLANGARNVITNPPHHSAYQSIANTVPLCYATY
ncbi:hypothetical protein OPT61_g6783 [Boeremia exigua]|uniref:Uncharacterized protein n=1 Tax=Boeremia exigua TaxID=749465 RepID=A0ACC2I4U7_9PLEO|nr:hypothetical protein OPT61_g6783 [Boeremia exigua]